MTGAKWAAVGLSALLYILWALATLVLQHVDPEALVNSPGWHPLLPFYMSRTQDVSIFIPIVLATVALLPLAWVGIDIHLSRRRVDIAIATLACVAFAIVVWGSHAVYLNFPLSMDEFYAEYQALIYSNGIASVAVPSEWFEYREAFFQKFLRFLDDGQQWISMYLPVHSLFRAPLVLIGAPEILNALAVAGSLYLTAVVARKVYPKEAWAPLAAILLMVGSAQLLVVGMSAYAHSMHLFLNLLWLTLFISERRLAFLALPWIGALALGLHQVHYHLFFAFPFFAYMLLQRRWTWLFYLCPIYGIAFIGFSNWQRVVEIVLAGGGTIEVADWATSHVRSAANIAETSSTWIYNGLAGPMNLFRFLSWQHLILMPLIVVAIVQWRRLPTVVKLLAIGCAITLVARFIVTPNGGHQWGYRYMHNMLGSSVLLAVAGLVILRDWLPANWHSRLARIFVWSTVASLFILVPVRFGQVNNFIRPFADASAYLRSLPSDIVIIDTASIWIGQDLVRNDPWLRNRPLLLNKQNLSPEQVTKLVRERSAVEVGFEDLAQFGVKPYLGAQN